MHPCSLRWELLSKNNYNTTFGSSGIAFNCTNQLSQSEAIKPSSLLLSKQPKKRLQQYNEQYNTDKPSQPARKLVWSVQQCSFCSKSGHRVTNCPKIAEYKHKSSMVSTNSERLNLINNFRSTTRIYASLPTPSQIVTTLEKTYTTPHSSFILFEPNIPVLIMVK